MKYLFSRANLIDYIERNPDFINTCIKYLAKQQTPEELSQCKTILKNDVGFSKEWAYAGSRLNEWITGEVPWNPNSKSGWSQGRRVQGFPLQKRYPPKRLADMPMHGERGCPKDLWKKCIIKHRAQDAVSLARTIAVYHWSQLEDLYLRRMEQEDRAKDGRIKYLTSQLQVYWKEIKALEEESKKLVRDNHIAVRKVKSETMETYTRYVYIAIVLTAIITAYISSNIFSV